MAANGHHTYVYVGLAGEGDNIGEGGLLRRSESDGWQSIASGLPSNPQVRALALHPEDPAIVYAGTQAGPFRSDDRGEHWEALDASADAGDVWSLAFLPGDPRTIFAGYEPCAIRRSDDGGETWRATDTDGVAFPHVTSYMPPLAKRVIGIAADPSDTRDVYAAIEVGGLLASRDGGNTWRSITDGLYTANHTVDLHGVQVSPTSPGLVYIIAQVATFRSRDRGGHWEHVQIDEMFPGGSYCRDLTIAPDDPKVMYLAAGAGGGGAPAGTEDAGALFRSKDAGETWDRVDIGETPPSRMFQVAIDREAPSQVFCCSRDGHLYASGDGGSSWKASVIPTEVSRGRHVYPMVCG